MARYLIKSYYQAMVAFNYIVDAPDEESALEKTVEANGVQAFRVEIDQEMLTPYSDGVDIIEITNDGTTTEEFWDCECETGYIHSKTVGICDGCGTTTETQPDSRLYELPDAFLIEQDGCPRPNPLIAKETSITP